MYKPTLKMIGQILMSLDEIDETFTAPESIVFYGQWKEVLIPVGKDGTMKVLIHKDDLENKNYFRKE